MQLNFTTFQNPPGIRNTWLLYKQAGYFLLPESSMSNVVDSICKFFDIYACTEKLIAISILCIDSHFGEINDHC